MKTLRLCAIVLGVSLYAMPLRAQDTTRGVRIGLRYDPGARPGVVVAAGRGVGADSVRAIIQRDLDFGDRVNVISLDASNNSINGASTPVWPILEKLGAAAMVQVTPTPAGLHLAVYDVAKQTTALIRDYSGPPMTDARAWRAMVHSLSDDLEESLTGTRGVAGTRVLFERGDRIWILDSDGEQSMPLTESGIARSPSWSPDGSRFAYVSLLPAQVIVQDVETRRARTLASGAGVYISPTFSRDGTNVVFAHGVDDGVDLFTSPASGGGSRRLSVGRGSDNTSPTFSPDGQRIAFTSGRVGHPEIYTMDADGTDADLLTPLAFGAGAHRASPDWSPDGRLIAFHSQIGTQFQLMSINLRDRSMKQLTSEGENKDPSWSPDARHLVFVSSRSGSRQLWVLDIETGRARQLTHVNGGVRNSPAWSPRLSTN